jgi:hypothetical protein
MTVTVNEDYVETAPELEAALLVEHYGLYRLLSRSFCYLARGPVPDSPPIFACAPPTHEFRTLELQRIASGITPLGISRATMMEVFPRWNRSS